MRRGSSCPVRRWDEKSMANILDYLDWRGDVPFSLSPFNDVDNLVLAQTAYTLLDGILDEDGVIAPEDAAKAFFEKYSHAEVLDDRARHKMAPFLLEKMSRAPRYGGMRLAHYINDIDPEGEAQMSAVTFVFPEFTYVADRGTDNSLIGWKEDFNLSYMPETEGQRMAVDYLNRHFADFTGKLYVGGHSKGGNFAVFASAFCDPRIRERIAAVYSNDGPGFREEVTNSEEYAAVLPKVTSIIPESTLVGALFGGRYDHKIVKSTEKGLSQHDATSWEVLRDGFVETEERSEQSLKMDEAVSNWLCQLSDEDRYFFTDVFFELLTSNGATTVDDLSDGVLANLTDVLKSARSMPKEKRKEFSGMLKKLIKSIRTSV